MIDVVLECNAISYDNYDEETVKWLIKKEDYCRLGSKERVYIYPVRVINESLDITLYQYQELQIEQKHLPPKDWEFITKDSKGEIVNQIWWGYEDGEMTVGMYIEEFLTQKVGIGLCLPLRDR